MMPGFVRTKRVTDPLDDDAKARLVGCGGSGRVAGHLSYVSSGSEHSADDDDSPCLSELVHGFLEVDSADTETQSFRCDSDHDGVVDDDEDAVVGGNRTDFFVEAKSVFVKQMDDPYRNLLLSHVLKGMEIFSLWRTQKPVYIRKVMSFLRELGHNASVCKTKWESSGGLNAGNYEFIDVALSSTCHQSRYIIDLDFASQFEVARPVNQYMKLVQSLPRVFVGKNEELKRILKVMSDAAKRSLKSRDLSLPPWRKNRYMQNKWLGPYRRTSNQISGPAVVGSSVTVGGGVKCRLVGFDDAVNGRLFVSSR